MCNCGKNSCNKCDTKVCHPCYDTLVNTCKEPCDNTSAQPIDCLNQEYCDEGCESFLEAKCILFADGTTLEDKFTELFSSIATILSNQALIQNQLNTGTGGGNCPTTGTITGNNTICI